MFVSVARTMTDTHRNRLALASDGQEPEILHLASQGEIVSADLQ